MAMLLPVFVLGPVQAVNATVCLSRKLRLVSVVFQEPIVAHWAYLKVVLVVVDFLGLNPNELLQAVNAATHLPSVVNYRHCVSVGVFVVELVVILVVVLPVYASVRRVEAVVIVDVGEIIGPALWMSYHLKLSW